MTFHAIYENGVFRPTSPVDLPEHTSVRVEPVELRDPEPGADVNLSPEGMEEVFEILSRPPIDDPASPGDRAARHNEHRS